MKIIADENMPAVARLFAPFGEVKYLPGRTLSAADVADADILLVRSVTRVNRELLAGSRVKFVGSATIGTDHVDRDYLAENGIAFAAAPGCNAEAVVDYVLAVLFAVEDGSWFDKTVGIVGCGNVGSRLYRRLVALGVKCLCYDPFLGKAEQLDLCEFDCLREADILCLHTPLTKTGPHPTWHLFDEKNLAALKKGALLINAGRGAVIDNAALSKSIAQGHVRAILDVWEGEPGIDRALLQAVEIGTPHIAGYSLEGRVLGTLMVYRAFCEWQGVDAQSPLLASLLDTPAGVDSSRLELHCLNTDSGYDALKSLVLAAYDPREDYRQLQAVEEAADSLAEGFDGLRKNYPLRREFASFNVQGVVDSELQGMLAALGFEV